MSYRVNEIFYSLQGEGYFTGTPAVFLRFSGCNRACAFCDTDHSGGSDMTAAEIVEAVSKWPARHIVITGGEPLLQLDAELIDALHSAGFFCQIETNGSLPVPEGVDWVTCSPKDEPWAINRLDELKIVFLEQDVEEIADRILSRVELGNGQLHLFLQPCSGENIHRTIDYIKRNPHWRLSLQTHRLLGIH